MRNRKPQKVEAMYAWIATEPDGGEGVCSTQIGHTHFPLVGADMDRVTSLRPFAEATARVTGYRVRLMAFRGPVETLVELRDQRPAGRGSSGKMNP